MNRYMEFEKKKKLFLRGGGGVWGMWGGEEMNFYASHDFPRPK